MPRLRLADVRSLCPFRGEGTKLASILHGDAQIGDEGVVTVTIDRSETIVIDGIRVSPEANIPTNVQFKPLSGSGANAARRRTSR